VGINTTSLSTSLVKAGRMQGQTSSVIHSIISLLATTEAATMILSESTSYSTMMVNLMKYMGLFPQEKKFG
jgi:hypothetical protein